MDKDREIATVPYYVVESLIAVHRKQVLYLCLSFLFVIIVIVSGFVYMWTQYDYESTDTITKTAETTVQQDGSGVNVYGSDNEVSNGASYTDRGDNEEGKDTDTQG